MGDCVGIEGGFWEAEAKSWLRGLGKNLEALRWASRGGAETFADAGWEREESEGVDEMRETNER
jgi:hypothetical protein